MPCQSATVTTMTSLLPCLAVGGRLPPSLAVLSCLDMQQLACQGQAGDGETREAACIVLTSHRPWSFPFLLSLSPPATSMPRQNSSPQLCPCQSARTYSSASPLRISWTRSCQPYPPGLAARRLLPRDSPPLLPRMPSPWPAPSGCSFFLLSAVPYSPWYRDAR